MEDQSSTTASRLRFLRTTAHGVGRAAGLTAVVVLGLLSFPSVLPWMIAGWLGWHTLAIRRGQPGWVPLMTGVAIVVVKRFYWSPGIMLLGTVAIVVAALAASGRLSKRLAWIATSCLWVAWGYVLVESHAITTRSRTPEMKPRRPVVCVGDSITSGLLPDPGYSAELEKLIRLPVINQGQSGMATDGALLRLPRLIEVDPQIVVLEIGGHDFLQGKGRSRTKQNIERLIDAAEEIGAKVVLVEVPRGFMTDPFASLERQIAHERDLALVSDSTLRKFVLWSPVSPPGMWLPGTHLSDDGIHPNSRGNKSLAEAVASALEGMYGKQILRH